MSDAAKSHDLEEIGRAYAKALTIDLEALVGVRVKLGSPEVSVVKAAAVITDSEPMAVTRCHNKNDDEQIYYCTVTRALAVSLGGMLMGYPEERWKELSGQPMDADLLDAFGEVMNLATAVLSRLFTDDYNLPPLGVVDTNELEKPASDQSMIEGKAFVVVRFPFELQDSADSVFSIAFPPNAAHHWFGYAIGDYSDADASATAFTGELEPTSVVFIEPNEETRNDIEDLEDEFFHSIWTLDPDELDPDELAEFAEVGAFFIEWDLATRTGLDFLECLRGDEITRDAVIIMMSAEPTEAKVRTAIRSGADTFMAKPVELEDMSERLNPLLLERQARKG